MYLKKDVLYDYYKTQGITENSFKFKKMSEDEIEKMLSSLNTGKATGHDEISAQFLKDSAQVICTPISYIINLSLELSVYPDEFKTAKVVPLFKKGDKNFEGNYRPVSILPVISKIFERVACDQLSEYLDHNSILYKKQSGFRANHSTDTALISLSDTIRHSMDKGMYTGIILLDLQKAFDTVNHEIMIEKLKAVGVDHNTTNWFHSYLTDRRQFVSLGDTKSSLNPNSCGVPQGSILGPLLFLLYINDMATAIDKECNL